MTQSSISRDSDRCPLFSFNGKSTVQGAVGNNDLAVCCSQ